MDVAGCERGGRDEAEVGASLFSHSFCYVGFAYSWRAIHKGYVGRCNTQLLCQFLMLEDGDQVAVHQFFQFVAAADGSESFSLSLGYLYVDLFFFLHVVRLCVFTFLRLCRGGFGGFFGCVVLGLFGESAGEGKAQPPGRWHSGGRVCAHDLSR